MELNWLEESVFYIYVALILIIIVSLSALFGDLSKKAEGKAKSAAEIAIAISFIAMIALLPVVQSRTKKEVYKEEFFTCAQSHYKDGREFTEEQCYFFRDVLHGEYRNE